MGKALGNKYGCPVDPNYAVPVLQGSQSFLQMRRALHHCRESPTHELSDDEGSMKGLLSVVFFGYCSPLVA